MKIEKISDTQVKFILSEEDLAGKDIKLEDLAVSNDKPKSFFRTYFPRLLTNAALPLTTLLLWSRLCPWP